MRQMAILHQVSLLESRIINLTVRSDSASVSELASRREPPTKNPLFQPKDPRQNFCFHKTKLLVLEGMALCVYNVSFTSLFFMSPITDGSLNNTRTDSDLQELSHVVSMQTLKTLDTPDIQGYS